MFCGMGPHGESCLQLIVYSLRLISWLSADNLQISCDFLGGFEKKA
ncbi:Non-structural protein NS-S [Segatella copri]|uniref:Non-structural protein NS-S n=1 Tax=Segatella copri TaxID=165179 RepID=A0AA91YWD8_9BACT|nr:Non-structural protein NS-S [Segatella copri]